VLLDLTLAPEIVERGAGVFPFRVELRQLGHRQHRHVVLERDPLEAAGRVREGVLRRLGGDRRREELQVVHHHQRRARDGAQRLRHLAEVVPDERPHVERQVAEPQGRGPHFGPADVVELPGPELVHRRPAFDRERPFEHPLLGHLAAQEGDGVAAERGAERHGEGERRLAAPDVAGQHHEVAPAEAAAQEAVHARESGGDGVGGAFAGGGGVAAGDDQLGRGARRALAGGGGHGGNDTVGRAAG
jgi:hypothetical protein